MSWGCAAALGAAVDLCANLLPRPNSSRTFHNLSAWLSSLANTRVSGQFARLGNMGLPAVPQGANDSADPGQAFTWRAVQLRVVFVKSSSSRRAVAAGGFVLRHLSQKPLSTLAPHSADLGFDAVRRRKLTISAIGYGLAWPYSMTRFWLEEAERSVLGVAVGRPARRLFGAPAATGM